MQTWKGNGKHSLGWSKCNTVRDVNILCDSQTSYTHRGTHTVVGGRIAFAMLKTADISLSFLILPQTPLL